MSAPSITPRLTKREALPLVQRACAIAHGRGAGMSLLGLWGLVLEEGLPSRAEREAMLADRLGDTISRSLNGDTANPPA